MFFSQADLWHALPRVLLLQGREDEKREGICEFGFAAPAQPPPLSLASPQVVPEARALRLGGGVGSARPAEQQQPRRSLEKLPRKGAD